MFTNASLRILKLCQKILFLLLLVDHYTSLLETGDSKNWVSEREKVNDARDGQLLRIFQVLTVQFYIHKCVHDIVSPAINYRDATIFHKIYKFCNQFVSQVRCYFGKQNVEHGRRASIFKSITK